VRLIKAAAGIVAAVWCCSALADDGPCYGMPALSVDAGVTPTLAIVKPGDRARFVKGGEQAGCPNASAACAGRAFVVGGDAVVVSTTAGDYACATFTGLGPKAISTSGFLPRAQLGAPSTEAPVNATTWAGEWRSGDEQTITIRRKPDGRMTIEGDATWGGHDPERVKRGAINAGNLGAEGTIADGVAAFTIDGDGTIKPIELKLPADSDACRAKLWRLGPYLVAADNLGCGGMNVTFTGVYRKTE